MCACAGAVLSSIAARAATLPFFARRGRCTSTAFGGVVGIIFCCSWAALGFEEMPVDVGALATAGLHTSAGADTDVVAVTGICGSAFPIGFLDHHRWPCQVALCARRRLFHRQRVYFHWPFQYWSYQGMHQWTKWAWMTLRLKAQKCLASPTAEVDNSSVERGSQCWWR